MDPARRSVLAGTLRIQLVKKEVAREPLPGPGKLCVEFHSQEEFQRECARNLSKGGIFVPTSADLELRQLVSVELVVVPLGRSVVLEGEIVHRVAEELAAAGAVPGVAVHFLMEAAELRDQLESFAPLPQASGDERVGGSGRRSAARSRARVPVRVEIDGEWHDGLTRNLSTSGVLVALACDAPAVGKEVGVQLLQPRSGDALDVRGVVRRHANVRGETCLGIEFEVDEADCEEVAEFVSRVRSVEHNRRLGGINGPIADLGVERLLAMFGSCAPEGTLTLMRGAEEGYVSIDRGQLSAQLGDLDGRQALEAMLAWREGSFEFDARIEDGLVGGAAVPLAEVVAQAGPAAAGSAGDRRRTTS